MRVVFATAPDPGGISEVPGRWPPLALVHLAGAARAAGHDCQILDALSLGLDVGGAARRILEERPDVVCVTAATAGFPAAVELGRRARDAGAVTVFGGIHASFMYPEFLPAGGVDFAVVGEGEETIAELLDCLENEEDPSRVAGLAFAVGGKVVRTAPRPRLAALDPLPKAWDLLDWNLYGWSGKAGSRLGAMLTSRGCGGRCPGCPHPVVGDQTWRGRSPDSVAYEMSVLRRDHGVDVVALYDPAPTFDPIRWGRLVDRLGDLNLGVEIIMYTRAEDVVRDGATIHRWRAAGVVHVGLCRDPSKDQLQGEPDEAATAEGREAVRLLREQGISSEAAFWFGFPDETRERMERTAERARAWSPDLARFQFVAPLPFTPAWRSMGPYVTTRDYRHFNHRTPVLRSAALSPEEVRSAAAEAERRFVEGRRARLAPLAGPRDGHT